VTKDMGNIRFAKIVKTYATQPITKQDLISFSKENEDFNSMFRAMWKDVSDNFYVWRPLKNALFGYKEVWNDCGAFSNYVFYKVEGKISAIRVRKAEGSDKRTDDYDKENVGELFLTVNSEDVVSPTTHFSFDEKGNVVETSKLMMYYDQRVLSSQTIVPEWSQWEESQGGQFYSTKSDGIWFEIKSLDFKVNTTFDCGITYIVSRPEGFPNPEGQEINKCPIKCRVRHFKIAGATSFRERNYLYQVEI
jgi:hypothetical protein